MNAKPRLVTRRRLLAGVLGMGGLGFYTWGIEPHWLEITRGDLPVSGLPPTLQGKTLLHLTDIHVGRRVSDSYLLKTFARLRELRPDFVVYTGDFVCHDPGVLEKARRLYAEAPLGRLGTVGAPGNHDYGAGWQDRPFFRSLMSTLDSSGIRMLCNQVETIGGIQFAGIEDRWGRNYKPAETLRRVDPEGPALVLSHNPDNADDPVWGAFSGAILSGHTHGGQCKPPFLPPPLLPVKNKRYTRGWFQLEGGRSMYINRGVGHLTQVRFNVRPEAALFTLTRAEAQGRA